MRLRNIVIATTTLVAGTIIGATTQHMASADVTSGDRPVLVPIETCRIADTRPAPDNVGPKSSPLGPGEVVTISAQEAGTDCTGKIPATATALSLNITALNATSNSFLTVWPEGPQPTASALNPAPGQRVFNAVTTELAADQTFRIFNNRGNVDVFVDINGYYENHNHDDRYYTQDDIDANFVNKAEQPEVFHAVVNAGAPASITRSSPGVTLEHAGVGSSYFFTFPRNVTTCFWHATLGGDSTAGNLLPVLEDLGISATQGTQGFFQVDPDEVAVAVYDDAGAFVATGFTLTVTCP